MREKSDYQRSIRVLLTLTPAEMASFTALALRELGKAGSMHRRQIKWLSKAAIIRAAIFYATAEIGEQEAVDDGQTELYDLHQKLRGQILGYGYSRHSISGKEVYLKDV